MRNPRRPIVSADAVTEDDERAEMAAQAKLGTAEDGKPVIRIGRLDTIPRLRREAVRVYVEMRMGRMDSHHGRRLVACLGEIAAMVETSDLAAQMEELEARVKAQAEARS